MFPFDIYDRLGEVSRELNMHPSTPFREYPVCLVWIGIINQLFRF